MKIFLRQLWARMNEPHTERVLLVLLPCLSLMLAAGILLPRLISMSAADKASPEKTVEAGLVFNAQPMESLTPVITPQPTATPAPEAEVLTPVEAPGTNWLEVDGGTYYVDDNGTHAMGLELIDGKLYYFDENGLKADALGIDVSEYNKGINWELLKLQGVDYAIIRVGGRGWESGNIYDDDFFVRNLACAEEAGIDIGLYFYSTAVNQAEACREASYAVTLLQGLDLDYPIYIDVEQSGDYPLGRSDTLSKTKRTEVIDAFCDTVRNSGYRSGVYSGQNFYNYHVDYSSLAKHDIWLASYTTSNRLPGFSYPYDMWQLTDGGITAGIRGMVDINVIYS